MPSTNLPHFFGRATNPDFNLMPSTPIANYAYANQGDYTFSNATRDWGLDQKGFSNGFAISDLDNDGDLDLVINNIDAPATLYANESQQTSHGYLKISLQGPPKNPLGLGSKIRVKTAEVEQTYELTLTRGYQSSVDPVIHVGLGEAENCHRIGNPMAQWNKTGPEKPET